MQRGPATLGSVAVNFVCCVLGRPLRPPWELPCRSRPKGVWDQLFNRQSAEASSFRGQRAGQLTERFLVSFVRDLRKIPGQFETHTLARANPAFGFM